MCRGIVMKPKNIIEKKDKFSFLLFLTLSYWNEKPRTVIEFFSDI